MFNLFKAARKGLRGLAALAGLAAMAACDLPAPTTAPVTTSGADRMVALLVPYGSPNAGDDGIARGLENAARLAAADLGGSIEIKVYPTAGQPAQAASAAQRAIADGADVILGPLRSDAANAAALVAQNEGVNVLAFSNNTAIAGGNLFVLGNTFENTANRIVRYAARQGRNRLVIVHPTTPAGQVARSAVAQAAVQAGVQVVGDGSFEFSQEGIASAMPKVTASVRDNAANAVMITDGSAGALPFLAELLPSQGINPNTVKYLGLTPWNIPPQTLSLSGLQGGWFTLPDPNLTSRFEARYLASYGSAPNAIAGLGYDGVAAIGALAAKDLPPTVANLTQSSGFAGVNGVFRFKADGTNERALAVAQVTDAQVQIIDPAPKSFSTGGF
ncbi:MAG: penicillin-binding protein activator [Litoreibacter sp.]|nr:penicillin-binding protein activator [Litoreibacter sp.]